MKTKRIKCKNNSHNYIFFPDKYNATYPRKIKGICTLCEYSKEFTMEEYREIIKQQKENQNNNQNENQKENQPNQKEDNNGL